MYEIIMSFLFYFDRNTYIKYALNMRILADHVTYSFSAFPKSIF